MLFTGKFELSIDAKQRMAIPARIRALLERERAGPVLFVMPKVGLPCLWLWPERTFEMMAGEVAPTLTPTLEQLQFDQATFPEAERVELDGAGRIRLPQDLLDEAGLGSRVLLVGVRHHLQLWDPAEWGGRSEQRRQQAAS